MRKGYRRAIALGSLLLLGVLLAGCDPSANAPQATADGMGSIVAHVVWVTDGAQPAAYQPGPLAAPQTIPSGVVSIDVYVSASDIVTVEQTFSASANPTGGVVNNVPAGSNRTLLVEGYDSSNTVIYQGQKSGLSVTAGQKTDAGTIYLTQKGSSGAGQGSWAAATGTMTTARWEAATVVLDGQIYVIGGYNGSYVDTVEAYDPATSTWTTKAHLATVRSQLAAVALDGKIYAIGGGDANSYYKTMEVYDPKTNTWTTGTSMPSFREGVTATVLNGKIYVIGGYNSNATPSVLKTVEVYDPHGGSGGTGAWSTGTSLLTGRNGASAATLNGKIYVSGGYNGTSVLSSTEVFTPSGSTSSVSGSWATTGSLQAARDFHASAVLDGQLYVVGGFDGVSIFYNSVEAYNSATSTWSTVASLSNGRGGPGAAAMYGRIYAIGGGNTIGSYLADVQTYTPPANSSGNTWSSRAALPSPSREYAASVVTNGQIYVIGGQNNGSTPTYYSTVQAYNPLTNSWTTKASMPTARSGLAAVVVDGKIYAIGGEDGSYYYSRVEAYDPISNTWESSARANMTTARSSLAAVAVSGKIYAIGGYNGSDVSSVEVYDPAANSWTSGVSLPQARQAVSAVGAYGKIYVTGGYNNTNGYLPNVLMYDPTAGGSWVTKAAMAVPRDLMGIAHLDGKIYALGGYTSPSGGTVYSNVDAYNILTNTWTGRRDISIARAGLTGAAIGGKVYATAGVGVGGTLITTHEAYTP